MKPAGVLAAALAVMIGSVVQGGSKCKCHKVPKKHPVLVGGAMRVDSAKATVVKKSVPKKTTFELYQSGMKALGWYTEKDLKRVEFLLKASDPDDDVCEPGEKDPYAFLEDSDSNPPVVQVFWELGAANKQLKDVELKQKSDGIWTGKWKGPTEGSGLYSFTFQGEIQDRYDDHPDSDDTNDLDIAGYRSQLAVDMPVSVDIVSAETDDNMPWNCTNASKYADITIDLSPDCALGAFTLKIMDGSTVVKTIANSVYISGGTYVYTWNSRKTDGTPADGKAYSVVADWEVAGATPNPASDTNHPLDVIKVDIEPTKTNVCHKTTSLTLKLTSDSYLGTGTANWTSVPAGISGSGTSITFNPSALTPTSYVVTAESSVEPDSKDTCVVHVIKINIEPVVTNVSWQATSVALKLTTDSYCKPGSVVWNNDPAGLLSVTSKNDKELVFDPSQSIPTSYLVTATSSILPGCVDTCTVHIIEARKIPLGGSTNLNEFIIGKVYVPTKWGGDLILSGGAIELFYTDGSDLDGDTAVKISRGELAGNRVAQGDPCEYAVSKDKHKWYYVKVPAVSLTAVSASFTQSAAASTRPWNFYWWAKKGDHIREPTSGGNLKANSEKLAGSDDEQVIAKNAAVAAGKDIIRCGSDGRLQSSPTPDDETKTMFNLYDTGGPLEKYDTAHSTTARAWEVANDQGNEGWYGHCLGAAMASILVTQPNPTAASGLTTDELEGLWAELGEKTGGYVIPDAMSGCPAGAPSAGADGTDAYAGKCHRMLEQYIKGSSVALQSNLRSDGGGDSEVWNHAVWKYEAVYEEAPGGNEKVVKITMDLAANDDHEPTTDDVTDREFEYIYVITYKDAGTVDESAAGNDWVSVGGSASYAPSNLLRVTGATWSGKNPKVTEAKVRALDSAN